MRLQKLNLLGIPSRQNKQWSIRSIKLLLSNPVYKGTVVWNRKDRSKEKRTIQKEDEWIIQENAAPAIVTNERWDDAQKRMQTTSLAPRAQTSPHLLGGLLKCGQCGSGMSIGWSGSTKIVTEYTDALLIKIKEHVQASNIKPNN